MKFIVSLISVVLVFFMAVPVSAEESAPLTQGTVEKRTPPVETRTLKKNLPGDGRMFPLGFFRGTFSVIQSPVEIIRGISTLVVPGFKASPLGASLSLPLTLPVGVLMGAMFTCFRVGAGVVDMISLGSVPLYSEIIPPFIWDSRWNRGSMKEKNSGNVR